jgi:hypothetical protein
MIKSLIEQYANKITKEDIINFSNQNNVLLKEYEVDNIYNFLKENNKYLVTKTDELLIKIKDKVEYTTYLKIKELVIFYKNKYQNYL